MSDRIESPVIKVGGSILRTAEDLQTITDRLIEGDRPPVVVTSAVHGITDRLVSVLEEAERGDADIDGFVDDLRRRHRSMFHSDGELPTAFDEAVAPVLEDLTRRLDDISSTGTVPPESRDAVLAVGERCAARLIACTLQAAGADSIHLDADELGIVTDGVFGRATVELAPTTENILGTIVPLVTAGSIPVVTGYFGRGETGAVTTFGRGGSDYSAAIVASCLRAPELIIWKDVGGFLTADPDQVPGAQVIPYMTYDEAAELAYLGIRVLHPRTLEPVKEANIPVSVAACHDPDAPGTRIGPPRDEPDQLRAIGARSGFGIVRMHGSAMAYEPGVGARVFGLLAEQEINIVNMAASQATFALLVDEAATARAAAIIESAGIPTVESVTYERGFTLLCIVGRNIGLREGVAGLVFTIVGDAGVNIEMISVGSSNVAMSFVIDDQDTTTAMLALARGLHGTGGTTAESVVGSPAPAGE